MDTVYRGTCRGQVTKLCKSISEFLNSGEFCSLEQPEKVEQQIVIYLNRLKNAHINMKKADEAVRAVVKEADFEKECEAVIEYDDKAVTTIAQLEHVLRSKFKVDPHHQTVSDDRPGNNVSSHAGCSGSSYPGVKLKSFQLKKFNGEFENWIPFWEQFKKAVHENMQFNSATKFNFLSDLLIGKAAATIAGFTPTEKCYNAAISLLVEEYGNTDKIVEKYVQKMMSIKPVFSPTDVSRLRFLYNETLATMRSLTALEVPSSQYNIVLRSVLLKALPTQLRVNFHRSPKSAYPSSSSVLNDSLESNIKPCADDEDGDDKLNGLISFLKREVEALEISQLSERMDNGQRAKDEKMLPKNRPNQTTATGLLAHTRSQPIEKCVFCNSASHPTKNCIAKVSVESKKAILMREGRCFRCSKLNHSSRFCKNQWVKCESCGGRHITSMCERRNDNISLSNTSKNEDGNNSSTTSKRNTDQSKELQDKFTTTLNSIGEPEIFLQTAKAIISAPISNNECYLTRLLIMDNGSQRTYVSKELSNKLQLPVVGTERVRIIPFGDSGNKANRAKKCKQVELLIKSQFNHKVISIVAIEVPIICADMLPVPDSNSLKLNHLELADTIACKEKYLGGINLLIGQDNYWKFSSVESELVADDFAAVNTFFGWTLQGKGKTNILYERGVNVKTFLVSEVNIKEPEFDVSNFWKLEQIGIDNCELKDDALKNITSHIKIKLNNENRYEVCLPWRESKNLNDNKNVALARLHSLTNKLIKSSEHLKDYDSGIRELVNLGIAEEAEDPCQNQQCYYMPHKPVYREDKTTSKLRVVFDASSSESGLTSLNEHLHTGVNLIPDILTTMLSFRSNQIAIVSDIEKAFLQISLATEDRDTHRFLWYATTPVPYHKLPEVKEFRMTRVTFGVTSSPFLLAATIQRHLELSQGKYGSVCNKLRKSFYIDDLILSVNNIEGAKEIFYKAKSIMEDAKMNLRKWNTNHFELKQLFVSEGLEFPVEQKVLGIVWNTVSDEIRVDVHNHMEFLRTLRGTKRNVMRAMARIYDPLGILGPFTVRIKILVQEIWKANPEWDENLNSDHVYIWQAWQEELGELETFSLQRCISVNGTNSEIVEKQLHIFADASPKAYGAVAYIRNRAMDNSVTITFVCSKNRVSPITKTKINELTLPKLELTAAVIAARLSKFLTNSLDFKIDSIHLWTDSTITLNWIMGQGMKIKPYITNRVSEINSLTNIYDWGHCSGKENPADLLTRGIGAKQLVNSRLWGCGPSWLGSGVDSWPKNLTSASSFVLQLSSKTVQDCNSEAHSEGVRNKKETIVNIEHFSKLKRMLRVTAYVFRFIERARNISNNSVELTASELYKAEVYWIKQSQQMCFQTEIEALSKGMSVPGNSSIIKLNPFLADGILRVKGRLPESEFKFCECHPIILPKCSSFSRLLVLDAHQRTLHGGTSVVLSDLRRKFWIVQGRQLIKTTLRHCVICKRLHGKSANEPWAALPRERVMTSRPFENVGLDFAGPLYIKSLMEDKANLKVYIMLITCAAIRAVHLELIPDMTVKSCINALRRFFSRRGIPKIITSDNAKTFKRADLELRKLEELLKTSDVQNLAANSGITWKFIPERAAWWGGFWERLVRSVKEPLKSVVGKANLDYEELRTLLSEVEAVVNSRPLTYITDDPNDLQPLTPSHFLNHSNSILFADFQSDGSTIASSWILRQKVLTKYLKRWRDDYLKQLRTVHQYRDNSSRSVKHGDVVLVHDDNKPRLQWKLAIVQTIFQGRDGKARACEIRLANQQVLRRPVQLLYPLEISSSMPGAQDEEI